jgi:phenylalanyl-tRNA synthetase beta chain
LSGIDGGAHLLTAEDLVIADEKEPVALAGVVGGEPSSVKKGTRKILLESGSFQAGRIRKTARRLSLTTDSARCFGRGGLNPSLVEQGRDRFVQLLTECEAIEKYEGSVVVGAAPAASRQPIPLRMERLQKILGLKMDPKTLATKLTALGFREEKGGWLPPSWRADVREEIDLIEELIRVEDLEKVPVVLDGLAEGQVTEDKADRQRRQIRAFLVERGFFEVLSGSLVRLEEGQSLGLNIAASPDASAYRDSLVPNLLRIAARNISRGQGDLKLFEVGRVIGKSGKEEIRLAVLVAGRERPVHWEEGESKADLFSLKGLWRELQERFDGFTEAGVLRETEPEEKKSAGLKAATWVLECVLETKERCPSEYREVSSFPGVQRDLSLILPQEVPFADVEKAIRSAAPAEMEGLTVFDRFRDASGIKVPKGFLSLGCRLQFRSTARTLTEQEVSGWEKKILESLATRCQARLRGVL